MVAAPVVAALAATGAPTATAVAMAAPVRIRETNRIRVLLGKRVSVTLFLRLGDCRMLTIHLKRLAGP
ncbi:hypothetical protein GCM10010412_044090 [Nonomuraea recticatena]|uniref:Secreted protein n=1 Tax=Nonomuraea recticatena TaxID=46178 RepID=A0ABN3S340_9ACTN